MVDFLARAAAVTFLLIVVFFSAAVSLLVEGIAAPFFLFASAAGDVDFLFLEGVGCSQTVKIAEYTGRDWEML